MSIFDFRFGAGTPAPLLRSPQEFVDFCDDGEGVGDVEDVSFTTSPTAVGIEGYGATLANETPPYGVRFLSMTAGSEALRVARRGASLTDLVQMTEE